MEAMFDHLATLERLKELMRENHTNAKRVCEELGMSNSAFTDWKKGKAKPGVEALCRLARRFNVSLDYLIFGKEDAPESEAPPLVVERVVYQGLDSSNPVDGELCAKFHKLPPENQGKVMAYLDGMLAALPLSAAKSDAPPPESVPKRPAAEEGAEPSPEDAGRLSA